MSRKILGLRFKDGEKISVIAISIARWWFLCFRVWLVRRALFPNTGVVIDVDFRDGIVVLSDVRPNVIANCRFYDVKDGKAAIRFGEGA